MPLIAVSEAQVWLEETKLLLPPDEDLPEEATASELVLSKLATKFDVSTWVDPNTTPRLVRKCIAMLVAAWRYNKHYSETEDAGNPYAIRLESMVLGTAPDFEDGILNGILNGSIDLIDVTDQGPTVEGTVAFYPDDAVGIVDEEEARRFTMGQVF